MSQKLYLIPTFIGNESAEFLPQYTISAIHKIACFITEKERTTRKFLKTIDHPLAQSEFIICELDKHEGYTNFRPFLKKYGQQQSVGLLSEAGMPCLADPGEKVVKYAHELGMEVCPLSGSSSIILALISSGFGGQNFAFNGYLSIDEKERIKQIKQLEKDALNETQIFMETPYRNNAFIASLLMHLQLDTYLCVACNLEHTEKQKIVSKPISQWRNTVYDFHKEPCVYVMRRF